jgi:hypothetical protein
LRFFGLWPTKPQFLKEAVPKTEVLEQPQDIVNQNLLMSIEKKTKKLKKRKRKVQKYCKYPVFLYNYGNDTGRYSEIGHAFRMA